MKTPARPWKLKTEEMARIRSRCLEVGECLEWQGALAGKGRPAMAIKRYGKWVTINLRPALARRKGLEVSASIRTVMRCANPICLNMEHMESHHIKTIIRRVVKKDTSGWSNPARRARLAEVARQRWGKLSPEAIADIRSKKELQRVYMARYSVSKTAVSEVQNFITHAPELQAGNPWAGLFSGLVGGRLG